MKKVGILIVIIVVLIGILALKIVGTKKEKVNKQEIVQLLEKGIEYDNYVLKYKQNGQDVTKIVKGNVTVIKLGEGYTWNNLETEEQIFIVEKTKQAVVYKKGINLASKELPLQKGAIEIVKDSTYEAKVLKQVNDKGKECIVIQAKINVEIGNSFVFTQETDQVSSSNSITIKLWVDALTGIVLKQEVENEHGEKETQDYDVELNTVKDSDIARPNLEGYKINNLKQ